MCCCTILRARRRCCCNGFRMGANAAHWSAVAFAAGAFCFPSSEKRSDHDCVGPVGCLSLIHI